MLKKYNWVIEWITTALLLVLGIIAVVNTDILLYTFGILFIIFGLFRIIPLIKTTDSKLIKWIIFFETIVDVVCGIILLCVAGKEVNIGDFVGYIIGGVIYLRGFVFLLSTSLKSEATNIVNFFFHIILITIGTIIFVKGGFNEKILSWIFFGIIVLCAMIIGIRGYKDYYNYRGGLVGESKLKKIKIEEDKKSKNKDIDNNKDIDKNQDADINKDIPASDEINIDINDKSDKPTDSIN